MNVNDKCWVSSFRKSNVGDEFNGIDHMNRANKSLIDCLRTTRIEGIDFNDWMCFYLVDENNIIQHVLTYKDVKRILKISQL